MSSQNSHLPKELKVLVRDTVKLLGEVILEEGGDKLYQEVESIRTKMIDYREMNEASRQKTLTKILNQLKENNKRTKHEIALSFTLMMELINTCEAAYRTFKLKNNPHTHHPERMDNTMVYVLTAHPTEARTPQNIELFRRIQSVAIRILDRSGEEGYMKSIIKHNLKLAWLLPVTRHEKPEVVDEANHLFSIILRPDIFDTILRADRDLGNIRIRTWVGGDKDGHPGVDDKVMLACLNASRKYFIEILNKICSELSRDIDYLGNDKLRNLLGNLKIQIKNLKKISKNDSLHLKVVQTILNKLDQTYIKVVGQAAPRILKLQSIFKLFPCLVVPIEMREDAEIIQEALTSKKPLAIEKMLVKIGEISQKGNASGYVQGFIISMCHSYQDIENARKLLKKATGSMDIQVIPLFETAAALESSSKIVEQMLSNEKFMQNVQKKWNHRFEIMLGYSDSSKGMGVLPSRITIAKTMKSLDQIISKAKVVPVFFHGSGGSIDRGGGSIKEQTSWWPKSALNIYKATIQGEMVERNFTSAEVSMSGMNKIIENFSQAKESGKSKNLDQTIEYFSEKVKTHYIEKIEDPRFFAMIEAATPYSYLSALKLGSRPAKRSKAKKLDLNSIRAIPWILCWTQTRILFPTWWGVGTAWKDLEQTERENLKIAYSSSNLFGSFVRILGFTLSKVELAVFRIYLQESELDSAEQKRIFEEFEREYNDTISFVQFITGEKDLLWYRPWLAESIQLRASMIHPLNLLQILAYRSKDMELVRKTIAGISSGMMTTG